MAAAGAGALSSSLRLIDPFVEHISHAGSRSIFAALNAWRHTRRSRTESKEANERLRAVAPDFSTESFLKQRRTEYELLLHSISTRAWTALKPITTEQVYSSIRRGAELGGAEFGAHQGAKLIEWSQAPAVVHARVSWATGSMLRSPSDPPEFAQLTVRAVTLQQPIASELDSSSRSRPANNSGGSGADSNLNYWVPVLDAAGTGHTYYWNPVSGATTWTKPSPAQFIATAARRPFRIESAGVSRTPMEGGRVSVVHNVVWERNLRAGAPALWRIAKL